MTSASILRTTTSEFAEASARLLLYPSCNAVGNYNQQTTTTTTTISWLWMTIVGLAGYKLCANAVQLYQFCVDWNLLICESRRVDLTTLHFFQQNFITRNIQIMKSLTTTTFCIATHPKQPKQRSATQQQHESKATADETKDDSVRTDHGERSLLECDVNDTQQPSNNSDDLLHEVPTTTTTTTTITCPICLSDFQDKEQISHARNAILCRHVFHTTCLQTWLLKHESCPVCRYKMVVPPVPPTHQCYNINVAATTTTTTTSSAAAATATTTTSPSNYE
jgi:hypothetical protein